MINENRTLKKITFINQYVTNIFVDIINDFVQHGVEVTLITGGVHSSHLLSEKVKVKKFISYSRNNAFNRILTWNLFGIRVFFYLLFRKQPLFVTTNPPFLPVIAWICKKRKQPLHVLYFDLYPEALVKMKYIGKGNPISGIWRFFNKKVNRVSDSVITISDYLKTGMLEYMEKEKEIHVIHTWTDNDYIKPLEKSLNPFIHQHHLEEKLVVLYSGNLGITHSIETILHTAYRLLERNGNSAGAGKQDADIQFVIIGDGAKRQYVENYIDEKKLKNVLLLPWQPQDQLPYTFSSADIGIITLGQGAEGLSVPSKTYDYMAAGCVLLVIADKKSELGILIGNFKCGEIFDPGDIEGISSFILEMKKNPGLLNEYRKRSRQASYDFGMENAGKFYEIIVNGQKGK